MWSSIRGQTVRYWDEGRAQFWDSAINGSSTSKAGILRRLIDELAVLSGQRILDIYWDVTNFYDSLDLVVLIELCIHEEFSLQIAAMDLQVHLGLRFIKWGSLFKPHRAMHQFTCW